MACWSSRMDFGLPSVEQGVAFAGLGVLAGLLSAFFGVGGGWIVTPVLLLAGLGAPEAVGTGMAFLAVTGLAGVARHARHGGVDLRLGAALGVALVAGVEVGRGILLRLDGAGWGEAAVQGILLAWMAGLGLAAFRPAAADGPARRLRIAWPPRITVRSAVVPVSLWVIAGAGLLAGVMAGLLGLGGGVILVPAMIGLMGVDHRAAVATSLVGVSAAGLWGATGYALGGHVAFPVAACLVAGSLAGVPLGVRACRAADAAGFRRLFGAMMLLAALSLGLALAGWRTASLSGMLLSAGALAAAVVPSALARRPRGGAP